MISQHGSSILVTGTNEEKNTKQERLVKISWERHFTREQWLAYSQEERETFILKDTLAEIILDLDKCLVRNVDWVLNRKLHPILLSMRRA